eukprot:784277-Amphidinium_carterae.1
MFQQDNANGRKGNDNKRWMVQTHFRSEQKQGTQSWVSLKRTSPKQLVLLFPSWNLSRDASETQ